MSRRFSRLFLLAAFSLFGSPRGGEASEVAGANVALAEQLARTAVRFEIDGDMKYRDLVLRSALREDPDCSLARAYMGHVRVGERWLTIDQAERCAAGDPRRQLYRQIRDEAQGDWQREFALARWCGRHGYSEEQKFYLARVLRNQSSSRSAKKEAMRKLDVQPYAGTYLTAEEIRRHRQIASEARQAMDEWAPKAIQWRAAMASDNRKRRAAALAQLRNVRDPAAIPALELVCSAQGEELALEVVSQLKQMPEHEATLSLARHAVGLPWSSVLEEAVGELKRRSLHDFAPMLLQALVAPVQSAFRVTASSGGIVRHEHLFFQEGAEADVAVRGSFIDAPLASPLMNLFLQSGAMRIERLWETRLHAAIASLRAYQIEQNVSIVNAAVHTANEKTYQVLERTTGAALVRSPAAWWQWWQEYNEVHAPDKPTYTYEFRRVRYYSLPRDVPEPSIQTSCFAAGTKVRTQSGLVPIETIRSGDRVLSQDPETGKLAYKLVLETTVRPASPILKISVGSEEIASTKGHPFWVSGAAWRMAKRLEVGDRLHCIQGAMEVTRITPAEPAQAYNLVVDDFATYFVSEPGVLVHDNTYRRPTTALTPGLLAAGSAP